MLVTPNPIFILPVFQEVTDVDVLIIQYKPFASFYAWRDFIDLSGIVQGLTALDAVATEALDLANDAALDAAAAQTTANNALADAAAAQATADEALGAIGGARNRRVTMFHDEANVSGGSLTLSINTGAIHNFIAFSTAQGFNANQSFTCDLMPACKLKFIGTVSNASGIMGVYIDEVHVATVDWYNATTLLNQVKTVSFAEDDLTAGRHTLRLEVVTKNISSSGYALSLTKYWLVPDNDFA